jgi:ribosomal protein S6--L-glutamate ligase
MELNSSPGFEGLERATGVDIAGEIVDFAAHRADSSRRAMAL